MIWMLILVGIVLSIVASTSKDEEQAAKLKKASETSFKWAGGLFLGGVIIFILLIAAAS